MADNTCICCGRIIPEGRHICLHCGDYDDQQRFKPDVLPIVRTNDDLDNLRAIPQSWMSILANFGGLTDSREINETKLAYCALFSAMRHGQRGVKQE